jgi:hypothetical protein
LAPTPVLDLALFAHRREVGAYASFEKLASGSVGAKALCKRELVPSLLKKTALESRLCSRSYTNGLLKIADVFLDKWYFFSNSQFLFRRKYFPNCNIGPWNEAGV